MTREQRIAEAREALHQLNFDAERTNERSAQVLLSLLQLGPATAWSAARNPLRRVVEIMEFIGRVYGTIYKPNTRETIRRRTLHQFVEAGLVELNPDKPERPVNSPHNAYRVSPAALEPFRQFGTARWPAARDAYLKKLPGLRAQYERARELRMIPITLASGDLVKLTPGGQNVLIREIVEDFCSRWTPGGQVLYIGDAGKDDPVFDAETLAALGIELNKHGKFPDLVVHMPERDWLVLIEAASTHGPVDAKRHAELSELFKATKAGLVFVSAFPTRGEMRKYLAEIAWETEVWCADNPTHLIHFNGERFLGPYG